MTVSGGALVIPQLTLDSEEPCVQKLKNGLPTTAMATIPSYFIGSRAHMRAEKFATNLLRISPSFVVDLLPLSVRSGTRVFRFYFLLRAAVAGRRDGENKEEAALPVLYGDLTYANEAQPPGEFSAVAYFNKVFGFMKLMFAFCCS